MRTILSSSAIPTSPPRPHGGVPRRASDFTSCGPRLPAGTPVALQSVSVSARRGTVHGWDGWWIRRGPLELGLVPDVGGRLMSMRWRGHELSFVHPDHAGRRPAFATPADVDACKRELGFVHWGGDKTWLPPH